MVTGHVQGVFFRDSCRREANGRGVTGWVRNRRDGTVEACFEGEPGGVQAMVDWCRHGPRGARVTDVQAVDEQPEGLAGFAVS